MTKNEAEYLAKTHCGWSSYDEIQDKIRKSCLCGAHSIEIEGDRKNIAVVLGRLAEDGYEFTELEGGNIVVEW